MPQPRKGGQQLRRCQVACSGQHHLTRQ
jgi:hypothetical protein